MATSRNFFVVIYAISYAYLTSKEAVTNKLLQLDYLVYCWNGSSLGDIGIIAKLQYRISTCNSEINITKKSMSHAFFKKSSPMILIGNKFPTSWISFNLLELFKSKQIKFLKSISYCSWKEQMEKKLVKVIKWPLSSILMEEILNISKMSWSFLTNF